MIFQQLKTYFFPVSYLLFFVGFFFLPTSTALSNLYYLAVAFPFLGMLFLGKITPKPLLSSKVFALSFIFLFYMWLTLWWSNDFSLKDIYVTGRRIIFILVFIASTVYLTQTRRHFLKSLFQLLAIVATAVAIIYPFYFYAYHPFPGSRLVGYWLLDNPINTSSIYAIGIFGCLYLLQDQTEGKKRFIYVFLLIPLFSYILLSQSRGPLGAFISTFVIWLLFTSLKTRQFRNHHLKITAIFILFIAIAIGFHLAFPDFFRHFIFDRGLSYRVEIWDKVFEKIKSAPIWGHGLNAENTVTISDSQTFLNPHSIYISTLYYGGAVGLFLFVSLIGYVIFKAMTLKNQKKQFIAVCTMVYGSLCILADLHTLIQHPKPFWIFFWFPIALCIAFEIESPDQKSWHIEKPASADAS
ncbi:MAG: O-antigen ligase family protein [Desulfobulbaceae bacterium]|nr:O-antigen ligase family protein [Desulfobulbaceae bacterium]